MKYICFFGIYDPEYSRNRVLIRGFEENGFEIVHCRVDPRVHTGLSKFGALIKAARALPTSSYDYIIVAFPGHSVVWLAYLLFGRGIVFDAFTSIYNSETQDRMSVSPFGPRAFYYFMLDWVGCRLSSRILLDTHAHIDYFVRTFGASRKKFIRVFVGSDDEIMFPEKLTRENNIFLIHFHGTFIPLQGIEYIVEAAGLLKFETNISDEAVKI